MGRNPALCVDVATDKAQLRVLIRPEVRLISFLTGVIVPRELLDILVPEPYNIHPGPPEVPGYYPEVFAISEGAQRYGVTAHVIAPQVDSGPIVFTQRFAMPQQITRRALADLTFPIALNAFRHVADHCAVSDTALPRVDAVWCGPLRTRRAFVELCETAERLGRACGGDVKPAAHSDPAA